MQGNIISDRYEIESRLGSGGMSTVYKAKDTVLERTVAVKVLAGHLSDDDRFVARFRREALAVAKLVHPNIVQVYDTGVDDDQHYIVMEYIEGRSGAQLLQANVLLEPDVAVEIGEQACAGLDYAHKNGIIHRDVKPGNLMIVGGPAAYNESDSTAMTVKLADFGIARAGEQTRITQAGSVVGTAAYLAPEQARGDEATPASDVYALGVVLYQFLTGRLPYEGSSLTELAIRQQNERPLPPHTYNDHVPDTLGGAVLRALDSDPWRRYTSATELGEALQAALNGTDVTLEAPLPPSEELTRQLAPDSGAEATRPLPPRRPPPPRRAAPIERRTPPPRNRRGAPAR
ncbi:MAG: eukaryotic-like serine/threonine-protein kinase, partial [Solirubrobacterales bacterium]|nr:eukaryotic-like serine/threonine-protein kinase [Solirubrobacterales bacterium]